ncbi:MAG: hypothetical protein WKG07_31365 [Hymenobacter sp.]
MAKIAQSDETTEVVDVHDASGLGIASRLVSTPQLQFQTDASGTLAVSQEGFSEGKARRAAVPARRPGRGKTRKASSFSGKGNIGLNKEEPGTHGPHQRFCGAEDAALGPHPGPSWTSYEPRCRCNAISLDAAGKEKNSNSGATTAMAAVLAVAIYFFIFLYGVQIMRGVGRRSRAALWR